MIQNSYMIQKINFLLKVGAVTVLKAPLFHYSGIKTVAVHSVADSMGLFVKMADEAISIGPPPAR